MQRRRFNPPWMFSQVFPVLIDQQQACTDRRTKEASWMQVPFTQIGQVVAAFFNHSKEY